VERNRFGLQKIMLDSVAFVHKITCNIKFFFDLLSLPDLGYFICVAVAAIVGPLLTGYPVLN
jgi:hypothetical protein